MVIDPVSPIPAFAALLFAMLTAYVLARRFAVLPEEGRFVTIDGLRGYLAFFVFLHHSCLWYFYLKTGEWKAPPSNLYANFGQSSVAFFFMITGFLFSTKLINGRTDGVDWLRLYVSRILRLTPLYFLAMGLLFVVVATVSNFHLNEPLLLLLKNAAKWLSFTMLGASDLNGVEKTFTIIAGVAWSLPYEWLFYLSLPLLAFAVGKTPAMPFLALGVVGVIGFAIYATRYAILWHVLSFAGGISAALLVRHEWFCRLAPTRVSSFVLILSVCLAVVLFSSPYAPVPLFLFSLSFALIAGGNTLFGAFSNLAARALGEISYSIYLLHGLALFVFFNFLLGRDASELFSPSVHWLLIILATPVLVSICFATFYFIERPFMMRTAVVSKRIHSVLARLRNTATKQPY